MTTTNPAERLVDLLDLEQIEVNIFRGRSPQESLQRVFGGQVAGQALVAAGRTTEGDRPVHSLHAYFLRPGRPGVPIVYQVERHPKNRPLSKGVSAKYQRDIESGRWQEATPEGLIFDVDGWGTSFQHRMKALANVSPDRLVEKYGHPYLNFWVFPDQPREIFEVVDQGYKRTAAHLLRVPYATSLGTAARHLAALADGDRWGMPRFPKITTPEIVETFHAWPELTWYIKDIHGACTEADIPIGPHAAVLAQVARTPNRDLIPDWLDGARYGLNLSATDPRLHLRRRFHAGIPQGKGKRDQAYALIVKAWNAYAADEPMTILRHMSTEVLPRVTGFEFGQAVKAA